MKARMIRSGFLVLTLAGFLLLGCAVTKAYSARADVNEVIEVARIAAESFSYYKSLDPKAGNFYVGEKEIEGQCSDYALKFVLLWNERHPENPAELVAVNQVSGFESGSYRVLGKRSDYNRSGFRGTLSKVGWYTRDARKIYGSWHPKMGFYELRLKKAYEVKRHFGSKMTGGGPHVWAKVGDIIVDPTWADCTNTSFAGIGEDSL